MRQAVSRDRLGWKVRATLHKYDDSMRLIEEVVEYDNLVVTSGLDHLTELITGTAPAEPLDSNHVRLGVGDDNTAANVADTDLSTGTNQFYQVMEATFPTQSGGNMEFKASFGPSEANFAWNCWGLDVDNAGGVTADGTVNTLINRKVVATFGTKAGGTWELTVDIDLA